MKRLVASPIDQRIMLLIQSVERPGFAILRSHDIVVSGHVALELLVRFRTHCPENGQLVKKEGRHCTAPLLPNYAVFAINCGSDSTCDSFRRSARKVSSLGFATHSSQSVSASFIHSDRGTLVSREYCSTVSRRNSSTPSK